MSLYLVATPIGNLEDITLRAIRTLKEVDMVFAEDTRRTAGLLNHLEIKKPLNSYHEFSKQNKHDHVLSLLKEGKHIALCSDAGMPCIADPGQELVRDAIVQGIEIIPIPGANAMLTGLIASGLSTDRFAFMGFFPRKKDKELVALLASFPLTAVFYESPMRIKSTIKVLAEAFPQRKAVIARELTKVHEEYLRGSLLELHDRLTSQPIKGEIVLMIEPAQIEQVQYADEDLMALIKDQMDAGDSAKTAVEKVAQLTGEKKNRIYKLSCLVN